MSVDGIFYVLVGGTDSDSQLMAASRASVRLPVGLSVLGNDSGRIDSHTASPSSLTDARTLKGTTQRSQRCAPG